LEKRNRRLIISFVCSFKIYKLSSLFI